MRLPVGAVKSLGETRAAALQFVVVSLLHPAHELGQPTISPWIGLRADLPLFAIALIAAAVMARIERRPMASYGLPLREAFGGRFWLGALIGFVSVSVLVGAIVILHGGRLAAISAMTPALIGTGALYALTFLFVAFLEEFLFRGYALATLAQGIGFWPAAALLSMVFGAFHLLDKSESPFGIAQVVLFGLVFFYGVPDSGQGSAASLLQVALSGPVWLTGGTAGPEGSIFSTVLLVALVPLVALIAPRVAAARAVSTAS